MPFSTQNLGSGDKITWADLLMRPLSCFKELWLLLHAAAAKVVHAKAVGSFCVKQAYGPEVDRAVPT